MASSSSSSVMASPGANGSSYDVFLSFRGEDSRNSFTDHLYDALKRAGICTFRDNEEINRGKKLQPEIEKAIKESRASIVVLSENYAASAWCLEELALILEQRRECNHFVLPVFYHVDPSDVRKQNKTFAIEVKSCSRWTYHNVNRWNMALREVADLAGMVLSGSETDFIAKILDTILCKLDLKLVSTPAHLTGMETRAECINLWLKDEDSGAEVLAICGMGGSGKTTLAQYIYNLNKHKFESSSFLHEIGKHYKQSDGLFRLQKQLLKDVLGGNNINISNVCEGTSKIEEALQMKRVLIVLDDIDEHDELAALLGTKTSHSQTKIIITTRLLDINSWFGSISWSCRVNKLELLNDHESLELLSWYAFGSKIPMEGFEGLSVKLAEYCAGNPLALKVLGSSLFVSAKDPRKKNNIIEIWRSTLNSLNSLKGDLDCTIQGVLQKSFDSLPRASHKELFLHIACFFVGESKYLVVKILEDDLYAKAGIMTLINRCLLTVSPMQQLMMHLLQEMGRKIVHEESKDPAKRSRVWHDDESYRLLGKGDGSETIEGLALDMGNLKKGTKSLVPKTGYLAKMDKLKLLRLKDVELTGTYNNFPELRWLCWHGCHSKTLPFGLLMSSLVAIDLSYGNLETFEPPTDLHLLKILNFRASHKLISIRNLYRLPNLEILILGYCSSLTHICRTIGGLESLSLLDLTWCDKLWKGSCNNKFVNQVERLKALCIGGGIADQPFFSLPYSLKNLFLDFSDFGYNNDVPVVFHGQSLTYMGLSGCLFEFLPNNIDLKMLRVLNLTSCPNLKFILCLPSTLEELNTHFCELLEKITFQSGRFRLRDIQYVGCIKLSEIQGLFKLVSIANLDEADLGHMKWIKAYEDCKVELIGDKITKGRIWKIQMLYEYGIKSTFLSGIKDESMTISDYTSASRSLFFRVPPYTKKCRIQGLNVMFLYRSSGEDKDTWTLLAKISNTTKSLTWIYNPVVYCKPRVDEDVVWLSYWPIGNILDTDDKVTVCIVVEKGMVVSECRASLVYMDDEVDQENFENYTEREEVIGGDLSEFEVTTGGYYLCRRDIFKSRTSFWLKTFFGDTVHYEDSRGWRKSRHTPYVSSTERETYRDTLCKSVMPGVSFDRAIEMHKIETIVSRHADDVTVANRLMEFGKFVNILRNQHKITILRRYRNGTKNVLQRRIKVTVSIFILFLLVLIGLLKNYFV